MLEKLQVSVPKAALSFGDEADAVTWETLDDLQPEVREVIVGCILLREGIKVNSRCISLLTTNSMKRKMSFQPMTISGQMTNFLMTISGSAQTNAFD